MTTMFRSEFGISFAGAVIGGLAIMPYSLRLLEGSTHKKPLKMPVPALLLLSFLQTAVQSAVAIGVGLLAAHKIGLGAPYLEAAVAANGSMPALALMLARTLLLNAPIGLLCGWLFWRYGLEAAIVAHFSADIVYPVGGTILLRLIDHYHFVSNLGR